MADADRRSGEAQARPRLQRREMWAGILFILVPALLFVLLRVIPTIYAFVLSFTDYSIMRPPNWVGLSNYETLLSEQETRTAFVNSLYYMVGTVFPSAAIGLFFAILLNQKLKGISLFRTAYYIPQVASWVAISMIWVFLLNPSFGVLNYFLSMIGLPKYGWLSDPDLAMPAIIMVSVWRNIGYDTVIYLAGLQGIPAFLYEAARVDGASSWRQFRRITWPLLLPTTTFIIIMTGIFSLQAFDQIYVLTQGGPGNQTTTLVFHIWRNAFQYMRMGYASAIAFVLFMVIFCLSLISLKWSNQLDTD
jgi:ABC-type sugar transport system permease subunit